MLIIVRLPLNEPFISTYGVGPLTRGPPSCAAMFVTVARSERSERVAEVFASC